MNGAEWSGCLDPHPMLQFLQGKADPRQSRLFACACCREVWNHIHVAGQIAIDLAEKHASRLVSESVRRLGVVRWMEAIDANITPEVQSPRIWFTPPATAPALATSLAIVSDDEWLIDENDGRLLPGRWSDASGLRPDHLARAALCSVHAAAVAGLDEMASKRSERGTIGRFWKSIVESLRGLDYGDFPDLDQKHGFGRERRKQCQILRDIFGNPFRPVAIDPAWLTSTAVALARGIYDDRGFDRMPILADALEDAGCDNADILAHCRDAEAIHVRGCWVIDKILGKD